jgi:tetratricopeptide (TPR) repeat protein
MKWLKQLKRVHKKKLFLVAVTTLIIVGCGAAYLLWHVSKKQDIATPEQRVTEIVENATTPSNQATAQKKLKELADGEKDTNNKLVYLSGSADLYFNTSDYKSGLEVTKQIEALRQTALSAGSVAEAYMQLGDFKNAAKYYGIAASRSDKPTRETERAPYNDYMIMKRQAEAKI